jgi:hypothetical protein
MLLNRFAEFCAEEMLGNGARGGVFLEKHACGLHGRHKTSGCNFSPKTCREQTWQRTVGFRNSAFINQPGGPQVTYIAASFELFCYILYFHIGLET